jgi:hypothetical protein
MAAAEKKGAVARCRTAKVMSSRITGRIALRFHDSAAEPPLRQLVHHNFSNQKPRKRQCVAGKFFSSEAAKFEM